MRMDYSYVFALAIVLDSIELSSQFDGNPNSRRNPGSSSSARQHSPGRTCPEEPPLRSRSKSPQGRPPSSEVLGYTLGQLGYIRLIPRTNQSLRFEFRKYVFPACKQIRLRAEKNRYIPVPTQEHIVLSAPNGDTFAILEHSGALRGLYRTNREHSRVKINMISNAVENMTPDEARDCPIGDSYRIFPHTFIKIVTNSDSLQSGLNPDSERNPGSSSSGRQQSPRLTAPEEPPLRTRSKTPPGKPPTLEVLGYGLGQLGYVRLIPISNQIRRFEFRRYVIPADKPIRLQVARNSYVPVPTREHIVLSTSNGDVFAILEHTGFLRGMYRRDRNRPRIKINMISGAVINMTVDESKECKVGIYHPITSQVFMEVVANNDSLSTVYH